LTPKAQITVRYTVVRLTRSIGVGRRTGGQVEVPIKKIVLYIVIVFVLYTIITSPERAADLVQVGFEGISDAAKAVGQFMTELIS
jgi:hypothetical protein